ncbi:MAG TPA: glycosyltransferase family 4 protein [Candidatus Saccharimonadia bacterium]|nr:glycosyltransferase family 4 protein [Candidatus Saccharimonadia bacterium]
MMSVKSEVYTFLSIGRLERQKGCEYLIRAAALLIGELPGVFRVVIIGDGSQYDALLDLARELRVEDVVLLVGRKDPSEVRTMLSRTDAAVFPSLYETTPLTLLEAWAATVPVIITPVGILHEVSPDFEAAYIVSPGDERSLMQAMRRCMTDHESSSRVAAKGYEESKKYAWPLIAQSAEAIYGSVV